MGVDSCWIHRAREVFEGDEGRAMLRQWGIPDTYIGVGNCILATGTAAIRRRSREKRITFAEYDPAGCQTVLWIQDRRMSTAATGLMDTGRKDVNGGTDLMDTGRKYETGSDGPRGAGAGRAEGADLMKACRLCPRNCGADRSAGRTGACGVTAEIRVGRAALHMWEEPCISGKPGLRTVFFAAVPWAAFTVRMRSCPGRGRGKSFPAERLAEIFLELQEKGASNINLVTASHYIPQTAESLTRARRAGLTIPAVFNCSGYEEAGEPAAAGGKVDVYLTDFKYMDSRAALRYSGAADYPERAKEALAKWCASSRLRNSTGRG